MIFDLAVIGGGPAGCAAAIVAARNGASVLLREKGGFPRHKVCGEFVSAESLDLLRTLLVPDLRTLISIAPGIQQTRMFAHGTQLEAEIDPPAASITRFDLDAALWSSCIQNGVDARSESAVCKVDGTGPFRVAVGNEVIEARALINASGRWSNFASVSQRAQAAKERWIGVKAHFLEAQAPASVDLYFFDGGYCGVQPVGPSANGSGTRINACAMVRADVATTLQEVLECHPELLARSRAWQSLMPPVSTSPLVFHEPEPLQNRILKVGDSATFVDPFVGDGISLALRSGALASQCLTSFFRGEGSLPSAAANYSNAYRQSLARVFRTSSRLRGLLVWPSLVRKAAFSLLARTPRIANHLVKMTR